MAPLSPLTKQSLETLHELAQDLVGAMVCHKVVIPRCDCEREDMRCNGSLAAGIVCSDGDCGEPICLECAKDFQCPNCKAILCDIHAEMHQCKEGPHASR